MMEHVAEPDRSASTKRQRIIRAISFWISLALVFTILRLFYLRFGFGIPCPLYFVTGLLCPGCGMFRAIGALLQVDLWQAVRYNALSLILLPALAAYCIRDTIRYINAVPPAPSNRMEMIFLVGAAVVSALYAIMRNIPIFDILRPTGL